MSQPYPWEELFFCKHCKPNCYGIQRVTEKSKVFMSGRSRTVGNNRWGSPYETGNHTPSLVCSTPGHAQKVRKIWRWPAAIPSRSLRRHTDAGLSSFSNGGQPEKRCTWLYQGNNRTSMKGPFSLEKSFFVWFFFCYELHSLSPNCPHFNQSTWENHWYNSYFVSC